ncbi:MAG: PIN domain-containing protein [Planctomycetaceae bacterium]|jgi:predicted nucleic acid-binding protein|nr:PIN domain-containing protein [Planctomycetaceae bacterium]
MLRVYLDNCCYNRPFDDQTSLVIRFETDAKLYIQELIKNNQLELVWSFFLDYENNANPFQEAKNKIFEWKSLSIIDCDYSNEIETIAEKLVNSGLRSVDASHVACAIYSNADFFITTDKKILNKKVVEIQIINPIDFIRRYKDA